MKNLLSLFAFLLLLSCHKKTANLDPMQSEWLLPLVKGELSLKQLGLLENKSFSYTLAPEDIGQVSNTPVSSMGFVVNYLGPIALPTQDIIQYVHLDSLLIGIDLFNSFPIPIKPDLKISLYSSSDTNTSGSLILSTRLAQGIAPQTNTHLDLQLQQAKITDSIYLLIEHLAVDSFSNVVFSAPISINIEIKKLVVKEVALKTNKTIRWTDTVAMNANNLGEAYDNLEDSTITGFFHFYNDNFLPIHANLQLYFLQKSIAKDSLFTQPGVIQGAVTDQLGRAIQSSSGQFKSEVSKSKLNTLQQCNQLVYAVEFNTNNYPTPFVVAEQNKALQLQIVSDLKVFLTPVSW